MRARGTRGATATRRRTRDRRILLVVAHGRETATALSALSTDASTAASSIVDPRWEAESEGFALIMSPSVHGGPVAVARAKAALPGVAERQRITVKLYPVSYLGGPR
jgi:glycine cleavage system regulatory protein